MEYKMIEYTVIQQCRGKEARFRTCAGAWWVWPLYELTFCGIGWWSRNYILLTYTVIIRIIGNLSVCRYT